MCFGMGEDRLYLISEKISGYSGRKTKSIFLLFHIVCWSVLALILAVCGLVLFTGTILGHGVVLFLMVSYVGTFLGFYGGICYLYRK